MNSREIYERGRSRSQSLTAKLHPAVAFLGLGIAFLSLGKPITPMDPGKILLWVIGAACILEGALILRKHRWAIRFGYALVIALWLIPISNLLITGQLGIGLLWLAGVLLATYSLNSYHRGR